MKKLFLKLPTALLSIALLMMATEAKSENILSTTIVGKGQPMILIHGMSCSADVWDDVTAHYKKDYEIHLITLKGFGNKENVESEHFLKEVKNELIDYVKSNKLKNTILMGHSMGGFLSLWAAAEAPTLFSKIIAVDGIPYFPAVQMPGITPEMAQNMANQMNTNMKNVSEEAFAQQQKMIVAGMIANEDKRQKVVEMGVNSNRTVTTQAYGEMYTTDIRSEMEKVKAPVLVLGAWAAYEQYGSTKETVENNYKAQCKDIDNVKIAVADEAYHFIFYDEPKWFFNQVDSFLASK
ncbi:alpha/beta hydrolase [Marivirga harenae]|uniref:alpha/beta fold hydrolase n=1 Tax=Marivirga harenae TaxID=2010992 RepID=UPI0026DF1423|nr:alpha/beta hydrolase [Marivirga harenae]WKV11239.1 alpha/beta hydrolase [Marivirga harenae]